MQHHSNRAIGQVGDCQIQSAIAVEVCGGHISGQVPGGELQWILEATITIAKQNRDRVVVLVGDSQVNFAISVEIARGHRAGSDERAGSSRVSRSRLECAVAIAEQNGDILGVQVGYSEIKFAVAIEVERGHSDGVIPRISRNRSHGSLEAAIAIAEENGDGVIAWIRERQVELAISI